MKKLIAIILLTCATSITAQEWTYNLNEAIEKAIKEDKNVVLVFSGSDWCASCIKLEKKIWESEEYQKLAEKYFVMLKVDFPRRKKNQLLKEQQEYNKSLAEKYNKKGVFPLVVVLDKKGNILGKTGYKKASPTKYFNDLKAMTLDAIE